MKRRRGGQAVGMAMHRRILLGVDPDFSPRTQLALRVASELLDLSAPDARLVLLHVIAVSYDPSVLWRRSPAGGRTFPPAPQQRLQAERALWKARKALEQWGIAPELVEWLQRRGTVADEILKVGAELGVDRIVIGSHGDALPRRVWRLLAGSTARRVARLAPCPVTVVVPATRSRSRSMVGWYREAVTRSLRERPGSLLVFTACDVALAFAPPERTVGIKEVEAAASALERLTNEGLLCCQKIRGELRYFND